MTASPIRANVAGSIAALFLSRDPQQAVQEVFEIVPASGRALGFFAALGVVLLAMPALFAFFAYAAVAARFEITDQALRIRSAVYGRTIPTTALLPEQARVVDLQAEPELQPTLRTNGIGLPGYRAGWFRLRGQERALLFVTDPSRVVYLPTQEGYSVMLSVRRPDQFLQALQRATSGSRG